eukprot:5528047-Prymnesium_polylepis.1
MRTLVARAVGGGARRRALLSSTPAALDARVLCVRRQLGRGLATYDHLPPTDGTTRVRRGAERTPCVLSGS